MFCHQLLPTCLVVETVVEVVVAAAVRTVRVWMCTPAKPCGRWSLGTEPPQGGHPVANLLEIQSIDWCCRPLPPSFSWAGEQSFISHTIAFESDKALLENVIPPYSVSTDAAQLSWSLIHRLLWLFFLSVLSGDNSIEWGWQRQEK